MVTSYPLCILADRRGRTATITPIRSKIVNASNYTRASTDVQVDVSSTSNKTETLAVNNIFDRLGCLSIGLEFADIERIYGSMAHHIWGKFLQVDGDLIRLWASLDKPNRAKLEQFVMDWLAMSEDSLNDTLLPNSYVKSINKQLIAEIERVTLCWQTDTSELFQPEYIQGRISAYRHVIKLLGGAS